MNTIVTLCPACGNGKVLVNQPASDAGEGKVWGAMIKCVPCSVVPKIPFQFSMFKDTE